MTDSKDNHSGLGSRFNRRRLSVVLLIVALLTAVAIVGLLGTGDSESPTSTPTPAPTETPSDSGLTYVSCNVGGESTTVGYAGDGTESSPYEVSNVSEFQCIGQNQGAHYVLVSDIDASGTSTWNDGAGFAPIGNSEEPFNGSLAGNEHTITGLTITRSDENRVGLFGHTTEHATVRNLDLSGVSVTGGNFTGAVAGTTHGHITDVSVTGEVTGNNHVGGVTGAASPGAVIADSNADATVTGNDIVGGLAGDLNGKVLSSHATGDVTGERAFVGGLVGSTASNPAEDAPSIAESYATGDVTGKYSVGGLVGDSSEDTITESYATGDVTGEEAVGGAIGSTVGRDGPEDGGVTHVNVYATGDVTGDRAVGGYVGVLGPRADTLSHVYATGEVAGGEGTGGLVGVSDGESNTVVESYWDVDATGQEGTAVGGTGLSTSQMTGSDATSNMPGFDFDSTWSTGDGYPALQALD